MIDYSNDTRILMIMSILTRMKANDFNSEDKKRQFVYDLAALNSLATKGYKVERTAIDESIYATKQLACDFMATHWSSRCKYDSGYSSDNHSAVLYVYIHGRQYSFHSNLSPDIQVAHARYDEWDRIEGGGGNSPTKSTVRLDQPAVVIHIASQSSGPGRRVSGQLCISRPQMIISYAAKATTDITIMHTPNSGAN